jgi:hypothetical protein
MAPTGTSPGILLDADKPALESLWDSMVALKKRVGRLSYSVIRLYPVAEKIARFAPIFDDLACSYKNEGSIPFTRSNSFLSIVAVFPVTVIRHRPDRPGFRWFPAPESNPGIGGKSPTGGLVLSIERCWASQDFRRPPTMIRSMGAMGAMVCKK